ncbi:MAG: radical SAM protein [Gemmatimonadetes bacterium]|nr:radical SAM protein [Gemmatimonadota bacterium]
MATSVLLAAEREAPAGECLPHVVAWNLTRRCNLRCSHCYISAGPSESAAGELDTAACRRVIEQLLAVNPAPMLILSGGEPLLRDDLPAIASYAARRGATVVVGTNGTLLTEERIVGLMEAGVTGVAVSVDSLRPRYHDSFRRKTDALADTMGAIERLRTRRLDFIVQTTATRGNKSEVPALIEWAAAQGAVAFNLYFLVPTGRGGQLTDLTASEYEALLGVLADYERRYRGAMMVRAKCAPHFIRRVYEESPGSPVLNYQTRCPCGIQYCRITPEGAITPCPYLPTIAGDLRTQTFGEIWNGSPVFADLRRRELGGKCGRCEYRLICGGCRARAFASTGDYLAADPSCVYEPPGDRPLIERPAVAYGTPVAPTLAWSPEAEERMRRIPSFVRGVVMRRVEDFARARGLGTVTPELLSEIRGAMPIDFSRRKPFFVRDD